MMLIMIRIDQLLHQLMNFRFRDASGYLEGASLGNLLLAALTHIHEGSFDRAIASIASILNIRGHVLPATLDTSELCADLTDGSTIVSEVHVRNPDKSAPIKSVYLDNPHVQAYPAAVEAIEAADIILIAPGGFYTSIIATLLVPGMNVKFKIYTIARHKKKSYIYIYMLQAVSRRRILIMLT